MEVGFMTLISAYIDLFIWGGDSRYHSFHSKSALSPDLVKYMWSCGPMLKDNN